MSEVITCVTKKLPEDMRYIAALRAVEENSLNRAPFERLARYLPEIDDSLIRAYTAILTAKRWKTNGVHLSVSFLDNPEADLRQKILSHMNAWSASANVSFHETEGVGQVRIARLTGQNGGYWSYLGTDVLLIANDEPTLNLEGFTSGTSEAEFKRVVRHETGHTLGFPHEHMRSELVQLLDEAKVINYYQAQYGWSETETRQQVLTPLDQASIFATPRADGHSIMCYQIPAALTKNNVAIPGGLDIDATDYQFCATCYPKP